MPCLVHEASRVMPAHYSAQLEQTAGVVRGARSVGGAGCTAIVSVTWSTWCTLSKTLDNLREGCGIAAASYASCSSAACAMHVLHRSKPFLLQASRLGHLQLSACVMASSGQRSISGAWHWSPQSQLTYDEAAMSTGGPAAAPGPSLDPRQPASQQQMIDTPLHLQSLMAVREAFRQRPQALSALNCWRGTGPLSPRGSLGARVVVLLDQGGVLALSRWNVWRQLVG